MTALIRFVDAEPIVIHFNINPFTISDKDWDLFKDFVETVRDHNAKIDAALKEPRP